MLHLASVSLTHGRSQERNKRNQEGRKQMERMTEKRTDRQRRREGGKDKEIGGES